MADALPPPEEFDLLAAELALGVLEGDDRLRALRLRLSNRGFRVAVQAWQERLAPMFDEIEPVPAEPETWRRIEESLDERAEPGAIRKLRAWRTGAIGAGAVAAALALMLLLPQPPAPQPAPAPAAIAQVTTKSGEALLVAQYDGNTGKLRVRASGLPQIARVPELWVIPQGGAPQSLGSFNRSGPSELSPDPATRALLTRSGSALAVTMEPAEGVPHKAPSGEILGTAPLSAL
jgi:anti-sigma-K factor RskA